MPLDLALNAGEVAALLGRDGCCWCTAGALRNWLRRQDLDVARDLTPGLAAGTVEFPDHVAVRRDDDQRWLLVDTLAAFPDRTAPCDA